VKHRAVNGPGHPWLRALIIAIALSAVLAIILAIGFLTAGSEDRPTVSSSATFLLPLSEGVVATSLVHGPTAIVDGRASGFSHDELGAAIATSNITSRIGGRTSPCTDRTSRELRYRVLAGDPRGDEVDVSLLADTVRSRELGGLTRIDAVLRWSGGDWHPRTAPPAPTVLSDTAGYTVLGTRAC
jgi:hypothetical protein